MTRKEAVDRQQRVIRSRLPLRSPNKPTPRLARTMEWTKKRPTMPGWYWYKRREDEPTILRLVPLSGQYDSRKIVVDMVIGSNELQYYRGLWAGPIEAPK